VRRNGAGQACITGILPVWLILSLIDTTDQPRAGPPIQVQLWKSRNTGCPHDQ